MNHLMTMKEIEKEFRDEWVLVESPKTNESLEVESGTVVWHSQDRDEVYRKAIEFHLKSFAMLYTGTLPQDVAVIL